MIELTAVEQALHALGSSWEPWLVVIPGLLIGLIFGAVPGLQISVAMAVFLPLTLYMDFLSAMLFLTGIFTGGTFGSGIPAILMNIPGTSSAIATAFDGYPMSRRGEHNEALGVALGASTIGSAIGYLVLFTLISPLSLAVLKLGPAELFVVVLWGMTLIAALSAKNIASGLLVGSIGLLGGTVGMSAIGAIRGTMGQPELLDGIPVVPAMIGLFAASELFSQVNEDYLVEKAESRRLNFRLILRGFGKALRMPVVILRGSFIGTLIGAVPGVGSSVSNIVSYSETQRRDPNPDSFGKGNPKGVAASESANSSSEGGSMVTLLALGIPGGGGTAVMLAAFSMHNITGGPRFIREQTDIVYAIIFANFAQVILLILLGLGFIHLLSAVVKVPLRFLVPSVLSLAMFGAFGLTGSMVGPATALAFGLLGWWMRRHGYPVAPMVVGLLLGGMAEGEMLRTVQISGGEWAYLLERPIAIVLLLFLLASFLLPRVLPRRGVGRLTGRPPTDTG
ncbi:MAG: tripartite tricarboxylate transporter permease [Alphaproteobacteria bacterium]|nr:tripartite tricarboxylate transporter permease [Alphaproteobacteria bacterium]